MNLIATIVLKVTNLIKSTMVNVDSHVIMVIAWIVIMIILYVNNVLKGMAFILIGMDILIVRDAGFKDVCSVRNLRKNVSSVKLGSICLQIQGV